MEEKYILGHELHTLDRMIKNVVKSMAEKDGLTRMQSWIIGFLYEQAGHSVFQKDIEAQFRIARSTTTEILKTMEKQGFLRREAVPEDARLKRLVLTEKGISHQLAAIQSLNRLDAALKSGISQEKLDIFLEVIRTMKQNLEDSSQ